MEFSGSKSFRYSVSLAETQPFPNQINRFSQIKDLALHHALSRQRFMVVILIHYTILVRGSQIEVTITVLNVRCRPLNRNEEQCSSTNKFVAERVFPSRIHISLIPPQEFLRHIKGLELTHSQKNPIATVTVGQGSQISANTRGRLEFSASTNRTVAMANDAWRVEQKEEGMSNNKNACLYIGALDFCMYHPVSGLEIISCKPKHGDSLFKKSYKSVNSPLDKEGGISFTQQDCGKEFKWIFCRPPDLDLDTNNLTMQWDLRVKLSVSYLPININTTYYFHLQHQFSEHFQIEKLKEKASVRDESYRYFVFCICLGLAVWFFSYCTKSSEVAGN